MRKKALLPLMLALTAIVLVGCPNPVTPPTEIVIDIVAIPGVTAPVLGATPVMVITETPQYTGTIAWNGTPTTFAASTIYTATITLTPKAGFTLTGVAANSFTVAGAIATNAVNSGVVTAVFPSTSAATISLPAIPGVTAPVTGATPVTVITETVQYTGTVAWNGTPPTFEVNTVYTATITLTPKAGFTLTGVAANSFTVAGAIATNPVNSGVVIAVFPLTKSSNANLSDLTVSSGTLSPSFAAGTTTYTVIVPNATTNTIVTATRADNTATLSSNNGVDQSLNVGSNVITITVTAQNGTTTKNYVVTVFRYGSDTISPNIGTLKYVPAGRFQRSATATSISEITQAYRMSQHEITRAQYLAIMGTDPSDTTTSSGTSDPVQRANWYHAIAFCNKLSLAEGLTPVYAVTGVDFSTLTHASIPTTSNASWDATTATRTNNGYRLPTEMEWMWAAMGAPSDGQGGGTNITGYSKAFTGSTGSNAIGDYAVYWNNSGPGGTAFGNRTTRPVGSKLANELELYDMSGNVFEWCWDLTGWKNPTGTLIDYQGAASGTNRVKRGGSWVSDATECTVASRINSSPDYHYNGDNGFRVVRP